VTALQTAAAQYGARGLHVFPCRDGRPLVEGGHKSASTDESVIRGWWRRWADAQIAVALRASGLIALDVDPRNGGDETIARLEAKYGALPRDCNVRSGGGGEHIYFKDPGGRLRGKLPGGVDVKCNGYVIAPPSTHRSGKRYEWIVHREPPPLPAKWIELLRLAAADDGAGIEAWSESASGKLDEGSLRQTLQDLGPRGTGNNTTYRAVCWIFHDYGCSIDEGWPFFAEWNARCGKPVDDRELWRQMQQVASKKPASGRGLARRGARVAEREATTTGVVCLADVEAETVEWLWDGRVPLGKVTILDGDPGLGKSTMLIDLAARVTRGDRMPEDPHPAKAPADVVLLSAEDGAGDTIRPRADAAGADVRRIHLWVVSVDDEGNEREPTLADVEVLEEIINRSGAALVVIDPFVAYLPTNKNSHSDQEMRSSITPIGRVAQRTGTAIILVRHVKKGAVTKAIHGGGGSIGIVGAARSALLVAKDPEDETGQTRVLAIQKSNLAREAASLKYRVVDAGGVGRIEWLGVSRHTADELVTVKPQPATKTDGCVEWLADYLASGPKEYGEIKVAAEARSWSLAVLTDARERLGVRPKRKGKPPNQISWWELPVKGEGGAS
jgi:hypothetical protein